MAKFKEAREQRILRVASARGEKGAAERVPSEERRIMPPLTIDDAEQINPQRTPLAVCPDGEWVRAWLNPFTRQFELLPKPWHQPPGLGELARFYERLPAGAEGVERPRIRGGGHMALRVELVSHKIASHPKTLVFDERRKRHRRAADLYYDEQMEETMVHGGKLGGQTGGQTGGELGGQSSSSGGEQTGGELGGQSSSSGGEQTELVRTGGAAASDPSDIFGRGASRPAHQQRLAAGASLEFAPGVQRHTPGNDLIDAKSARQMLADLPLERRRREEQELAYRRAEENCAVKF